MPLAGRARVTEQEACGPALFNAEDKGNCANARDRSAPQNNGTPPQFTDYGLIAIGLPRNNKTSRQCRRGSFRSRRLLYCCALNSTGRGEYCGLFRTPSLRNLALRSTFSSQRRRA